MGRFIEAYKKLNKTAAELGVYEHPSKKFLIELNEESLEALRRIGVNPRKLEGEEAAKHWKARGKELNKTAGPIPSLGMTNDDMADRMMIQDNAGARSAFDMAKAPAPTPTPAPSPAPAKGFGAGIAGLMPTQADRAAIMPQAMAIDNKLNGIKANLMKQMGR